LFFWIILTFLNNVTWCPFQLNKIEGT